jgi:CheY-like chemotaxis protein
VGSVIGLLDSHAIRKKLRLQQLNTEDELFVQVDPKHFKQIIFNLIHNAIRFTPEGGEVQVVIKSDFPNPFVLVDVRDNGCGIPETELPRLFDLYARYEGNQPKFGTGLGLGLSLCKTLTEYAGGTISVTSTVGVGTSFEVRLPLHIVENADNQNTLKAPLPESAQPLQGQSFLLIDDDTGSRDAVARLIQAWGGMVNAVNGATEAVNALAEREYDAVMIESSLSAGSGEAIARLLREEIDLKDTTVIVSADSADAQLRARQAGADKCITKPYNGKVLLASLIKSGKYSIPH